MYIHSKFLPLNRADDHTHIAASNASEKITPIVSKCAQRIFAPPSVNHILCCKLSQIGESASMKVGIVAPKTIPGSVMSAKFIRAKIKNAI